MTGAVLGALERFLLPNVCVACNRAVERHSPDALVCGVCRSRARRVSWGRGWGCGWGCPRCAHPLPPVGPCRFCGAWPDSLRWVRSAVWMDDEAREIVHHLKYEGYTTLGDLAATFIARALRRPEGSLVPVPLSARRLKNRGYNQASVIADALGRIWRLPVRKGILRRTRNTDTQTALTPEERIENVRGAFAASPPPTPPPQGRQGRQGRQNAPASAAGEGMGSEEAAASAAGKGRGGAAIILVDDVLTTGATLAAAATALEAAGWNDVGAVTFARAQPFVMRAMDDQMSDI